MSILHFEDFIPGTVTTYGGVTVDEAEMLAFAHQFDPQPMHIDREAAKASMAGELIASGWFTASLNMRMMIHDFILKSAGMGSPGLSELRWLKPVKAGDYLTGRRHVLGKRASVTKPDRGFVQFRFEVINQRNETVIDQINLIMFKRRDQTPVAGAQAEFTKPEMPPLPAFKDRVMTGIPWFEDLALGDRFDLGSVTFTADDIIAFAKLYDAQAFHLDEAAGRASHFGGLAASGWHTAANWMGRMSRHRAAAVASGDKAGVPSARLGPSPGFENLTWHRPVLAGDTIHYTSAIATLRPSQSKPEWGLVRHYNTGVNQRGETVFSFIGSVFWERRPSTA
jgi:acyl dehydratase